MIDRKEKSKLLSVPVKQIDLEKTKTIGDLVEAFKGSSIQSRNIGRCAQVWENMLADKDRPTIILGLSGALIAGGLRKVIRDMIEFNLVDVIASTGAVMYQDFYQAKSGGHYIGHPAMDDKKLRDLMIDRIYDTLVDEEKFEDTDRYIAKITEKLEPRNYSSREFLALLGEEARNDKNSILGTAYRHGVPVFSPALNDSSIGIGLTVYYSNHLGKPKASIDSIRDNYEIVEIIRKSKKTGVIYIGGGTPKNWINDAEVMAGYCFDQNIKGHTYAFQITTDSPQWGALSGSTLEEAQSWGKIQKEATKATAYVEATIALPLLVGHLLQRGYANQRSRLKFYWKNDRLEKLEK